VLYKQDVDLGFSLDQEQIINASNASGNSATNGRTKDSTGKDEEKEGNKIKADEKDKNASNDDIEKLKVLEELQQDKVRSTRHHIYIWISQFYKIKHIIEIWRNSKMKIQIDWIESR